MRKKNKDRRWWFMLATKRGKNNKIWGMSACKTPATVNCRAYRLPISFVRALEEARLCACYIDYEFEDTAVCNSTSRSSYTPSREGIVSLSILYTLAYYLFRSEWRLNETNTRERYIHNIIYAMFHLYTRSFFSQLIIDSSIPSFNNEQFTYSIPLFALNPPPPNDN